MASQLTIPCETIMQSIADGVFTVDLEWNITFFNSAAESITGIPAQEAIGRKCWEVLRSSLCDGQCALDECLKHDVSLSGKSIFIVRSNGSRVPISISAAPLRNPSGQLIGGVETFRDLSEVTLLRKEMQGQYGVDDIIGKSPALARIFSILQPVARSGSTVLLTGESGTGKELFARALHNHSERSGKPFVAINCAALPPSLLESELFGYKKGAFTDARKDKPGKIALARGGTLFLDEIGDMPLPLQAKLLRVLQEKVFDPLGSTTSEVADVRIIAATNTNMERHVEQGTFRRDLFFRLNVARIQLPALRERRSDIPLLTTHFVQRFNTIQGKQVQGLSEDVLAMLMRHDFSGNVRELENIIEYAFILCSSGFIQMEHLPENLQPGCGYDTLATLQHFSEPATTGCFHTPVYPRKRNSSEGNHAAGLSDGFEISKHPALPVGAHAPAGLKSQNSYSANADNTAYKENPFHPAMNSGADEAATFQSNGQAGGQPLQEASPPPFGSLSHTMPRPLTMRAAKKQLALAALHRNNGKRMAACRELGISKDTLRRILAQSD